MVNIQGLERKRRLCALSMTPLFFVLQIPFSTFNQRVRPVTYFQFHSKVKHWQSDFQNLIGVPEDIYYIIGFGVPNSAGISPS